MKLNPAIPAPVLKWAGGKTQLLPMLLARMPTRFGRYYEPFAGGAALFFRVAPERAVLGDVSDALMQTYRAVADDVDGVVALLAKHAAARRRHRRRHYLAVRSAWNEGVGTRVERAAAFVYLNRTCFNGLWRVNRAGEFNVPMGRYADPLAGIAARLRAAAPALARAELRIGDYRATLHDARRGDFVYLDPPYDGTFTAYNAEAFDAGAQAELAYEVRRLAARGVRVMVSNADTPRIRALYAGLRIDVVQCNRAINSDTSRRGAVDEVIVTAGYNLRPVAGQIGARRGINFRGGSNAAAEQDGRRRATRAPRHALALEGRCPVTVERYKPTGITSERVSIELGGVLHIVSVGRATQLRDELTRALGAPALTDREALVWAMAYSEARRAGRGTLDAAEFARDEVVRARDASATADAGANVIAEDARAMLAAMTGGGR